MVNWIARVEEKNPERPLTSTDSIDSLTTMSTVSVGLQDLFWDKTLFIWEELQISLGEVKEAAGAEWGNIKGDFGLLRNFAKVVAINRMIAKGQIPHHLFTQPSVRIVVL